jgi:hypothetical protein
MMSARKQNGKAAPWNNYQRCTVISAILGGNDEWHHLSHRPDRGHLGDPFVFFGLR